MFIFTFRRRAVERPFLGVCRDIYGYSEFIFRANLSVCVSYRALDRSILVGSFAYGAKVQHRRVAYHDQYFINTFISHHSFVSQLILPRSTHGYIKRTTMTRAQTNDEWFTLASSPTPHSDHHPSAQLHISFSPVQTTQVSPKPSSPAPHTLSLSPPCAAHRSCTPK